MEHLNFIATAQHNLKRLKKNNRNLSIIIAIAVAVMIVSRLFYGNHTRDYTYANSGMEASRGWPAVLFEWALVFFVIFALFSALLRFGQDVRQPALGVTNQGLFINQQMIRNALVPWRNIDGVALEGHKENLIIRIQFRDINAVVKGQFFVYRSLSKASLKALPSFSVSKAECVGDLEKICALIQEQIK